MKIIKDGILKANVDPYILLVMLGLSLAWIVGYVIGRKTMANDVKKEIDKTKGTQ